MSLDGIKSDQDSGAHIGLTLLFTNPLTWVGWLFFVIKRKLIHGILQGLQLPGPRKEQSNTGRWAKPSVDTWTTKITEPLSFYQHQPRTLLKAPRLDTFSAETSNKDKILLHICNKLLKFTIFDYFTKPPLFTLAALKPGHS